MGVVDPTGCDGEEIPISMLYSPYAFMEPSEIPYDMMSIEDHVKLQEAYRRENALAADQDSKTGHNSLFATQQWGIMQAPGHWDVNDLVLRTSCRNMEMVTHVFLNRYEDPDQDTRVDGKPNFGRGSVCGAFIWTEVTWREAFALEFEDATPQGLRISVGAYPMADWQNAGRYEGNPDLYSPVATPVCAEVQLTVNVDYVGMSLGDKPYSWTYENVVGPWGHHLGAAAMNVDSYYTRTSAAQHWWNKFLFLCGNS